MSGQIRQRGETSQGEGLHSFRLRGGNCGYLVGLKKQATVPESMGESMTMMLGGKDSLCHQPYLPVLFSVSAVRKCVL
jgi:hypothetical protein